MKKICSILVICLMLSVCAACGRKQVDSSRSFQVYYVGKSETKIEAHEYEMQSDTPEEQLEELLVCLSSNPDKLEYKAPLSMGFEVLDARLQEGRLQIDVNSAYKELPATTEVLVRAAIVRTMTQIDAVKYVGITVDGNQLYDNNGEPVGLMSADTFINNDGNEINTYELTRVMLYFASEDGSQLIATYREKYYSTNTPLERFVVEELIAGPSGQVQGIYPAINPETKIINVTSKDGICYVNLDGGFMNVVNNVSTDLSVYSIVNSLVELPNINKVQILINGEVPSSFSTSTFERNLDYVTTLEP